MPHNTANFGPLTAEIGSGVLGTPANFNGVRVLVRLLHGTPHRESKMGATVTMAVTLSILDRFAKSFYCCKEH